MSLLDEIKKYMAAARDDICEQFRKASQFELEFIRFYKLLVNEDLTPGPQIVTAFCGADCANGGEATCPIDPTSFVTASDGTEELGVAVNWGAISGATYYDIYRSVDSDVANAVKINTAPEHSLSYIDTFPAANVDVPYYYFVKGVRTNDVTGTILCESEFGIGDSGYCHTGGGPVGAGSQVFLGKNGIICFDPVQCAQNSVSQFSFTVPEGKTSIKIKAWGGGGSAGGIGNGNNVSGGGGGGAEYAEADLAVTPGELIRIAVGAGGNTTSTGAHYAGIKTRIFRVFSTDLISANGGGPGETINNITGAGSGAGGAGGAGGIFGAGTSGTTRTSGVNGTAGVQNLSGTGGNPGLVNGDFGKGGTFGGSNFALGYGGRVEISWL